LSEQRVPVGEAGTSAGNHWAATLGSCRHAQWRQLRYTSGVQFTIIDAFIGDGALGNPAAVAVVDTFAPDAELARIAREGGWPATTFVRRDADRWHVRWFTPDESNMCGHGTLATAHALFQQHAVDAKRAIRFTSRAGNFEAWREGPAVAFYFPRLPLTALTTPEGLEAALGANVCSMHDAEGRIVVELADETAVRTLTPNVDALRSLLREPVVVTARSAGPFDFVSRYFRKAGPAEDPVTGSAHAALAPFWAPRLDKASMRAFQASARGGVLDVQLEGDRDRVRIRGVAKTATASP
jgi:predicted PhzF superfamily epimerase YddE/YHI9